MRFRCESCGAQYAIADEKLGKKGVRVRCKKCSEIITVLPPEEGSAGSDPEQDHEALAAAGERENTEVDSPPGGADLDESASGGGDGFDLGADDELKSALDNILGDEGEGLGDDLGEEEEDEDPDLDRQATRVFNVEEMQQVQAEREQAGNEDEVDPGPSAVDASGSTAGAADEAAPVSDADRERVEWYAAVDDQQVGPMSLNEFAERWRSGEFDSETLVWKTGFEDWRSVFELAEFSFLAEEDEPARQDDWASQRAEPESDWPRGMDQDDRDASPGFGDDEEDAGYGSYDDEEEDRGGSDDYYDDEAASSAASAAAFAADVEWKPSALSSLSSLAEEELAELAPDDPEPEEEELPFDTGGEGLPAADGESVGTEEMDDGDSSLIAQIAAEEEAAAKRAELERAEQEQQAEDLRRKQEESALAAQEAAAREKLEEQRERAAPPEEKYIPPRTSLPKWAIGLMVGGGLMMLALVGTLGYLLAKGDDTPGPAESQTLQPAGPITPAGQPAKQPVTAGDQAKPAGPAAGQAAGPSASAAAPAAGTPEEPAKGPEVAAAGIAPSPPPGEAAKPVAKADGVKKPKPDRNPPPRARRRKRKTDKKPDRVAVAPRRPDPVEDKPAPKDTKPARHKPKGGILDFEDPDDREFAKETGAKPKPVAPKPEEKTLPPLSSADVLSVMKGHLAEFKACNRKQKQIDSSVRGKMVISFTIANSGRVTRVGVSKNTGQFKGTYVAGCIQDVIKRLKFPEFGGPPKKIPFPFTVN